MVLDLVVMIRDMERIQVILVGSDQDEFSVLNFLLKLSPCVSVIFCCFLEEPCSERKDEDSNLK